MISLEDSPHTYEYENYYKILPSINMWSDDPIRIKDGKKVEDSFVYSSDNNSEWMKSSELKKWIDLNIDKISLP